MKKKSLTKDVIVIGFALFAMFFGSGNLIFPPYLGRIVGDEYVSAMLAFMIMGVGLPLLGVMATAKVGGDFGIAADKVGKVFSIILMTALILAVGPFLAIPRTAATTYEISIRPFLPQVNMIVAISGYFIVNLFFVLTPSSVMDVIGKFLTPILVVVLSVLIIKGILFPIGVVRQGMMEHVFTGSLIEGYQTMDALAAVCFGGIMVATVKEKGYQTSKQIIGITLKASLIAIIGLGTVYGGLMYLGAHSSNILGQVEKTTLVVEIARQILGNLGTIFLGVAVGLACLTTSIGLTATGAKYFSRISKGRVSYTTIAIVITMISIGIACLGVDNIVGITTPVLKILYPVIMVLVILTLLGEKVDNDCIYKITVFITLIFVVVDVIAQTFQIGILQRWINYIPLSKVGFGWVIPALIAFMISEIIILIKK